MRQSQNGNVAVFILVGIALFAALCYTFMKGTDNGTNAYSKQQAKLIAQEILANAQQMDKAVNKLRQKGCSENQLNFYSSNTSTSWNYHPNPDAPSDNSCDIFHANGANLTPWIMPINYINDTVTGHNIRVKSKWNVAGTQSSRTDLVLLYSHLKPEVCRSLNDALKISPNTGSTETVSVWDDVYNVYLTGGDGIGDNGGHHDGKLSGCIFFPHHYYFYHVLINN